MNKSRRQFIKTSSAGALVLSAAPLLAGQEVNSKSTVYVGKGKAEQIIPKIIDKMGGIKLFVKPGSRVIIKPNMSFANPPEWATTTSPEAVYTVVRLCLDAGAKRVIVCDNTLRNPELCKQKTGIAEAVKGLKGAVVFTPKEDSFFIEKTEAKATEIKQAKIVREVFRTDCLISLPTAKSHSAGGVSLGLKGLMGLIKDRGMMHRADLHKAIAEQLYYIRPSLTIIDASRALLDNGPAGPGKIAKLDTFVGSLDPVAVDSFAVTLAPWYGRQFEGRNVPHIKHAGELGFGNYESDKISGVPV